MKSKGAVKLGGSGAIVSGREVRRFVRAQVAVVRLKRRRQGLSIEVCASWAGLSPRTWRNVEHGRVSPNSLTLARMWVAVNLSLEEMLTVLQARKIQHLRRIGVRKKIASGGATGAAGK